jgi:hypothetical protein
MTSPASRHVFTVVSSKLQALATEAFSWSHRGLSPFLVPQATPLTSHSNFIMHFLLSVFTSCAFNATIVNATLKPTQIFPLSCEKPFSNRPAGEKGQLAVLDFLFLETEPVLLL